MHIKIQQIRLRCALATLGLVLSVFGASSGAQIPANAKSALGSATAKNGFRNETQIAEKFKNWRADDQARTWLAAMGYKLSEIESVTAVKPHGEKADIQIKVKAGGRSERTEGISIKLVSSSNGFNQVDKRWVSDYAKMWKMPAEVSAALSLYVGETRPNKVSRNAERMFIDELDPRVQAEIKDFFTRNKSRIISDLFRGDGTFSAKWMLVAQRSGSTPRWVLRDIDHVVKFYSEGPVGITRNGNLKIGRVTVQRKGGDGGRNTAKMLQFKMNPTLLF